MNDAKQADTRGYRFVKFGGVIGAAVAATVALLWRPDVGGIMPGAIAFAGAIAVGIILGQLVGRFLARRLKLETTAPNTVHPALAGLLYFFFAVGGGFLGFMLGPNISGKVGTTSIGDNLSNGIFVGLIGIVAGIVLARFVVRAMRSQDSASGV